MYVCVCVCVCVHVCVCVCVCGVCVRIHVCGGLFYFYFIFLCVCPNARCLRPTTWLHSGSCPVFSFARTISMGWEHLLPGPLPPLISTQGVTTSPG